MEKASFTREKGSAEPPASQRLDSWKEIAAYLKRDIRTLHRWEQEEDLPVHRHLHRARASVYAYKAELDAWWDNRRPRLEQQAQARTAARLRGLPWAVAAPILLVALVAGSYFVQQRFWSQPTPSTGRIMLAVLPFENLSDDPEQEYFSDGLTEEMIAQLGRLQPERLAVIARTSAMQYKSADKGIDQIGRELRVDYILEGSVRREGDRVRISAQLVQVTDQTHLWAESYERDLANVFAIQGEVAERVARSLALELLPAEQALLASARPVNPEAYEDYLKGRYYLGKRTPEAMKKGLEHFQQSVEKDPKYAAGFSGLADSYILLAAYAVLPPEDAFPKARTAVMKALELDDTLADAHIDLAGILYEDDRDFLRAEREFNLAIQLNPNSAEAHRAYSIYLSTMGRHDEAITEAKRARKLDPLSLITCIGLGMRFYLARQYDHAIGEYRETLELDPNFVPAHAWLGVVYQEKKMHEEAITEFKEAANLSGGSPLHVAGLAHAYAVAGKRGEALKMLGELKELSKERYVPSYEMALVYTGLGDKDQAFAWLERASEERYYRVLYLNVDPRFDSLRSDPRFQALLRRLNFPE